MTNDEIVFLPRPIEMIAGIFIIFGIIYVGYLVMQGAVATMGNYTQCTSCNNSNWFCQDCKTANTTSFKYWCENSEWKKELADGRSQLITSALM